MLSSLPRCASGSDSGRQRGFSAMWSWSKAVGWAVPTGVTAKPTAKHGGWWAQPTLRSYFPPDVTGGPGAAPAGSGVFFLLFREGDKAGVCRHQRAFEGPPRRRAGLVLPPFLDFFVPSAHTGPAR